MSDPERLAVDRELLARLLTAVSGAALGLQSLARDNPADRKGLKAVADDLLAIHQLIVEDVWGVKTPGIPPER